MIGMRISLTQRGDEIRGTVELPADGMFVLEGLALVIETFARKVGVPAEEVVRDLHSVVAGKVTA
jgi:hypothetical protein